MNFKELYFIAKQIHSNSEDKLRGEIYELCLLLQEGQGYRTPEWYEAVERVLKRNQMML
jgi:hypothetical protein